MFFSNSAKLRKDLQKCRNFHSTSSATDQSEKVVKEEKKYEGEKKNKSLKSGQEAQIEKKEAGNFLALLDINLC